MAGKKSKNNPDARNKIEIVDTRICEICGKEGKLNTEIARIMRGKTMMWLCKDMACR